jgi:FkbM family methyltransferase
LNPADGIVSTLSMHFPSIAKAFILAPFRLVGLDIRRLKTDGKSIGIENPLGAALHLAGGSNPVVLDVGAHEGETIERLRSVLLNGKIYAFEADPRSILYFEKRYADQRNLIRVGRAVSDRSGPIAFHLDEFSATSSVYSRLNLERRYYPKLAARTEATSVEAVRLDDFAAENNIDEIDLLKIDIQGGELNAFRGASAARAQDQVIYTEAYFVPHYEGAPLRSILRSSALPFLELYDEFVATNGQLRYADAIFVSNDVRRTDDRRGSARTVNCDR